LFFFKLNNQFIKERDRYCEVYEFTFSTVFSYVSNEGPISTLIISKKLNLNGNSPLYEKDQLENITTVVV